MSSKTVNEDLLIVTQGSKHLADTKKPTDMCFLADKKTVVGFRNYIPTSACDNAQATQKTLIRGFRIVHSKSKIGTDYGAIPSTDDNFTGVGGGVANGQVFFKHANDYPGSHSKNVRVEGNWIVRTNDETQQNKVNCTGKFREGDGGITEDELEALLNKGCTVESVSMKCDHGRDTTTDRLMVLEGGVVTITMVHVNDAEVEPAARAKPKCQVPRRKGEGKLPANATVHPFFRVTRAAYPKTSWREALPALTKDVPGLTIDVGKEWIGEGVKKDDSKSAFNKDPKDKPDTKYDSNKNLGRIEGAPPLEGARVLRDLKEDGSGIPAQQARGRAEANAALQRDMELRQMRESMQGGLRDQLAERKARDAAMDQGRAATQSVKKLGEIGITTFYALKEVFYAKPVEVKVEALACAGGKPVTLAAYPPSSYSVNLLDLKEFKTAFKAAKDTIAKVRDFLKKIDGVGEKEEGAGADLAITSNRFTIAIWVLKDAEANIGVEFRELTRDSGAGEAPGRKKHEVFRAFTVDLKIERLIGVKFSYAIPISYATGAIGAFAQKLLDKVGADLNFKIDVELSVGVSGSFEYNEYGKIIWARKATMTPVAKFTISLNATARGFSVSIGASIQWKPTFELEPATDQPFCVKRLASTVDIKWFVKAAVNILGWTVDWEYGDTIWTGKIPEAKYALA